MAAIERDDERLHAQVAGSGEGHRVMADMGDVCYPGGTTAKAASAFISHIP